MADEGKSKASSGLGIGLGIAAGCGLGCVGLIVVVGVFGWWSMRAMQGQMEQMMAQAQEAEALQGQVAELDRTHPPRLPEDLATADVQPADVDAYLAVRARVDPLLADIAVRRARLEKLGEGMEPGQPPDFGKLFEVMREVKGAAEAEVGSQSALLTAARDGLREAGLGPTDFRRMLEIVEWRFLRRDDAAFLALPADRQWKRQSLDERLERLNRVVEDPDADEMDLRLWLEDEPPAGASRAELRQRVSKEIARARAELVELDAEAAATATLSPTTTAVLEARRAELEGGALPDLDPLLSALGRATDGLPDDWLEDDAEEDAEAEATPDTEPAAVEP